MSLILGIVLRIWIWCLGGWDSYRGKSDAIHCYSNVNCEWYSDMPADRWRHNWTICFWNQPRHEQMPYWEWFWISICKTSAALITRKFAFIMNLWQFDSNILYLIIIYLSVTNASRCRARLDSTMRWHNPYSGISNVSLKRNLPFEFNGSNQLFIFYL